MAVEAYQYTDGSDPDSAWTNETYAWDGESETYASRTIPISSGKETTKYLLFSTISIPSKSKPITKVEIEVFADKESSDVKCYIMPILDGTSGIEHEVTITGSGYNEGGPLDITSDATSWTWNDIENMDLRLYGQNTSASATKYLRIREIVVCITYEDYGALFYNNYGNLTIDSQNKTYYYNQSGTASCSANTVTAIDITDTTGDCMFALQPVTGGYVAAHGFTKVGDVYTQILIAASAAIDVPYVVYSSNRLNNVPDYGFLVYNEYNELVFSSGEDAYLNLHQWVYVPLLTTLTSTEQAEVSNANQNYFIWKRSAKAWKRVDADDKTYFYCIGMKKIQKNIVEFTYVKYRYETDYGIGDLSQLGSFSSDDLLFEIKKPPKL